MNKVYHLLCDADNKAEKKAQVQLFVRDTTFPIIEITTGTETGFIAENPVEKPTDLLEIVEEDTSSDMRLELRFAAPRVRERTLYYGFRREISKEKYVTAQPGQCLHLEVTVHTFDGGRFRRSIVDAAFGRRCDIDDTSRRDDQQNKICLPQSEALKLLEAKWNEQDRSCELMFTLKLEFRTQI